MKLVKVVVLSNLTFALGVLCGYVWWGQELGRARRDLDAARIAAASGGAERRPVKGIVRAVLAEQGLVVLTHEPIGTMPAMTMSFQVRDRTLTTGLVAGDPVEFTLAPDGKEFVLVQLRKER